MGYLKKIKNKISGSKEIKASSAYIVCSVLQKCLSIITIPIFTRLLTTEDYGISTVYSSSLAIVIIFTTLNLPYGSFYPAMMKFEKDRDGYISAVNTICLFFSLIYFVAYYFFKKYLNELLDLPDELMILMGFEMLLNTAILFWMGKARFEYKYKEFVFVTLLISVLGTVSSLLAVLYLPNKGVVKVVANSAVICIVGLVIMMQSLIKGKQCFNKTYWKYALTFNIPLIPYYLSQIIFNQSDRLMINKMIGRGDAALYGVAYTLAFVLTFVLNAVNNSYVPWMYRKIHKKQFQDNKKVSVSIAVFMAVMLLGIIALAPEIILIMAGEKYISSIWVVPPVTMSVLLLFYAQLFINVEFYFEEKYKLVGASILAAVANIVLNYYGIQLFGYVAAGYTTLISYLLFAFCNYLAMNKVCKHNDISDKIYDCKALLVLLMVFMLMGFGFMVLYPYRFIRIGIIFVSFVLAIIFNKKLIEIVKRMKGTLSS